MYMNKRRMKIQKKYIIICRDEKIFETAFYVLCFIFITLFSVFAIT